MRSGLEAAMRKKNYWLALLSWETIESRACGLKIFDVEKLREMTHFSSMEADHALVARFWRVFEAFTEEEKALYLKFVWGRSRLPIDCSKLEYKHELRLQSHMDANAFP